MKKDIPIRKHQKIISTNIATDIPVNCYLKRMNSDEDRQTKQRYYEIYNFNSTSETVMKTIVILVVNDDVT